MEFNVIPTISPEKSGKNTFFKSAETINLVTSFVSPICKVTSKTAIQYNISPFIYLHIRHEANPSPGYWVSAEYITFTKWHQFILNMSLKVTSKMTHIGRYLYMGSSLWESCVILTILAEKRIALSSEN